MRHKIQTLQAFIELHPRQMLEQVEFIQKQCEAEPIRVKNMQGVIYYYNAQYTEAAEHFVQALQLNATSQPTLINLGFTISQHYEELDLSKISSELEVIASRHAQSNLPLMFTYAHALLMHQPEAFERYIQNILLPILERKSKNHGVQKPWIHNTYRGICCYHIPKCGGTSFNQFLSHHFYGQGLNEVLPGYTNQQLLINFIQQDINLFPYFSSNHIRSHKLLPPPNYFTTVILRDPLDRLLSMYRQYFSCVQNGYFLEYIPAYNTLWKHYPATGFVAWLHTIPACDVNYQLSTFSHSLSVEQAVKYCQTLDQIMWLEDLELGISKVAQKLALPLNIDNLPKDLNQSPRKTNFPEAVLAEAKQCLAPEIKFIEELRSSTA